MLGESQGKQAVWRRRCWRTWIGLNVTLAVLLAVALVGLVNAWSARRYVRHDISRNMLYELSEQTVRVLAALNERVDVWVFLSRGSPLFHDIENLLREYQAQSPWIRVEYIDPDRNLARTEELAQRFNLTEPNQLVFHSGDRYRVVAADEVMDYATDGAREGLPPQPSRFRGELVFTAALYHVTQAEAPRVYFLAGHGERRIDNYDPFVGYSSLAKRLRADHIAPETLVLGEAERIPEDAAALVIAGPNRRLAQPEIDLISAYLEQSGRVLLLLDALTQTGLEPLLAAWGVRVDYDRVIDAQRTLTGRELFLTEYAAHPITRPLQGVTSVFYQPRSVEPLGGAVAAPPEQADKPHVTVLAYSSADSWAQRDPDEAPGRFDPNVDRRGPIGVAVAVERGPAPDIEVHITPTRMVVFGDSAFGANGALTGGDADFFMSALHWLLDREDWLAVGPRDVATLRLTLTRRDLRALLGWSVGGIPGLAVLAGVLMWLSRRR